MLRSSIVGFSPSNPRCASGWVNTILNLSA
nr:MAG TPA: hypothetical protein [Caudoviricetes sp.]